MESIKEGERTSKGLSTAKGARTEVDSARGATGNKGGSIVWRAASSEQVYLAPIWIHSAIRGALLHLPRSSRGLLVSSLVRSGPFRHPFPRFLRTFGRLLAPMGPSNCKSYPLPFTSHVYSFHYGQWTVQVWGVILWALWWLWCCVMHF